MGNSVELPIDAARQSDVFAFRGRDAPPTAGRRGHRHRELEVNLVVRGRARYAVDGRPVDLPPDAMLWLWPGHDHLLLDESADFEMWVAVWRPELVESAAAGDSSAGGLLDADETMPRQLKEPAGRRVAALMRRLARPCNLEPGHHAAGMAWLLRECWWSFCAADGVPAGTRLHPAVERAARWLADHASEPAANDFDALARRCGLSRWRLSRLFKAQIGRSLTDYRNARRLECARRLIGRAGRDGTPGRRTLLDAALAAGFGSYAQFYRCHVAHLGRRPSAG